MNKECTYFWVATYSSKWFPLSPEKEPVFAGQRCKELQMSKGIYEYLSLLVKPVKIW